LPNEVVRELTSMCPRPGGEMPKDKLRLPEKIRTETVPSSTPRFALLGATSPS